MEKYEKPKVEVIELEKADVICTSVGSGFNGGNNGGNPFEGGGDEG